MGVRKGIGRRADAGRAGAPRHGVSRGHRREGQARGHPPDGAGRRRRYPRPGADARGDPRDERREVHHRERRPVRRQRRRRRGGRPARREVPAAARQVQGPDQAVPGDRRRRPGRHHARRSRQQALPRDLQGAWRAQLRRVRPGQPGLRDGRRHRQVLRPPGAFVAEDHLQHRRGLRRHVGQLDSVRSQHGRRHALGVVRRVEEGGRRVSGDREELGRRREPRALDA